MRRREQGHAEFLAALLPFGERDQTGANNRRADQTIWPHLGDQGGSHLRLDQSGVFLGLSAQLHLLGGSMGFICEADEI